MSFAVRAAALLLVLSTALALGACGRRGSLQPPPSAAVEDPAAPPAARETAPDKPFVLDSII